MGIVPTPKANRARRAASLFAPRRRRQRGIAVAPHLGRNLLRGRWLVATLVVLLAAGVMVRLGVWQLGRLQGRIAANAAITRQIAAPPVPLDAQLATSDPANLTFRRVTVRGTWDFAHEVELRYRSFDGQAGIHLLTPLRIAGGDTVVLVDRGWIPYQQAGGEDRAAFRKGAEASIEGLIRESAAEPSTATEPGVFSQIDIAAIGKQLPYPIQPYWVQRLPAGDNAALPRSEGPPDLSNGTHLAYMVQWWVFAATLLITYVILANQMMVREGMKREERKGRREER